MRAIKLIRSFGSIEQLLESPSGGKYLPDGEEKEEYMKRVGLAREVFATLPPTPAKEKIVMKEVDEAKVRELLERCGLGRVLMEDGDDFERRAFEGDFYEKSIGGLGENLFADNPRPT
jgi:flap endonuclease-1